MAHRDMYIVAEMELVKDAMCDLERIQRALAHRHGSSFRALEKKLDAYFESPELGEFSPIKGDIGEVRYVLLVPRPVTEIIAEARRLGVI